MKSPDRTKQPDIKTTGKIKLLTPEECRFDNGIPCYSFHAGTQDVIKMVCVFNAGTWFQKKKLVAFSTVKMLTEGTKKYSAAGLAELFDSYGAHISTETEKDNTFVILYSLNKHLGKLLPVFAEIIRTSVFPQQELSVLTGNAKQELLVSMQRVNFLAKIKFAEQLFGKEHPYGQTASPEDYDKIATSDLIDFHKNYYHPGNLRIIASGKIKKDTLSLINKYFGVQSWMSLPSPIIKPHPLQIYSGKKLFVPKKDALQSGIRIGKILFTKEHPDYMEMTVLNTVLGGYFGSRLMQNIREDKGYTYGIGSVLIFLKNAGFLSIASEVGAGVRKQAVSEIYKEINRLRREPVSKEELELVKNYMLGSFLRGIDGPFALADRLLGILDYGFNFNEYYTRYIRTIKEITSGRLLELAEKYFREDSFYETVAGK